MVEYLIDPELDGIMPELCKEDYDALEKSILTDGFKGAPIMVWGNIIVDGHNRYKICNKHNIPYEIKELDFEDKEEVIAWMIRQQIGRRNLSAIQRIQLAEKYRSIYEKKAKENLKQATGGDRRSKEFKQNQGLQKSAKVENKIDVRAKLADTAGVSTDTYAKGKKILDSNNENVKQAVLSGAMSINAGYKKMKVDSVANDNPKNEPVEENVKAEQGRSDVDNAHTERLQEIKNHYLEYLDILNKDIKWLEEFEFFEDDEEVSSEIYSELDNSYRRLTDCKKFIVSMAMRGQEGIDIER